MIEYFAVIAIDSEGNFPEMVHYWERDLFTGKKKVIDIHDIKKQINLYETIEYVRSWFRNKKKILNKIEIVFCSSRIPF
jgi:hypothetical protein